MREVELCMKYADSCKGCPLDSKCEEEYQIEMEQRSGGVSEKKRISQRQVRKMDGSRKGRKQKKNGNVEMPM